jgi:hypothetical protein
MLVADPSTPEEGCDALQVGLGHLRGPRRVAFRWRGPFIKAALTVAGMHAGPPRPPSGPATDEELRDLRELFARAGVPVASPVAVR